MKLFIVFITFVVAIAARPEPYAQEHGHLHHGPKLHLPPLPLSGFGPGIRGPGFDSVPGFGNGPIPHYGPSQHLPHYEPPHHEPHHEPRRLPHHEPLHVPYHEAPLHKPLHKPLHIPPYSPHKVPPHTPHHEQPHSPPHIPYHVGGGLGGIQKRGGSTQWGHL